VLAHLLAELFQDLFASDTLFQQFQATVHPVVQADGFAENRQVDAFDQHDDRYENQPVNQWFCANDHVS